MITGLWLARHRRSLLFLLASLALAGGAAALVLPTSLFPTVAFPRVQILIDAGDQPAEEMELLVTRGAETAVRRVPGVRTVRSTTSRGSAEISVNFDWGLDMVALTQQVNAALAPLIPNFPSGTQVRVRRMDPTVFPIIAYSMTSVALSPGALHDLAALEIAPVLSGIEGVSNVEIQGGEIEELEVIVDPMRLAGHHLALSDVVDTVAQANVIEAVGRYEDHYKLFLAIADARLQNVQSLREAVLSTKGGEVVRIGDVASVLRGTVPKWLRTSADGRDAVLLSIYQQPGSNSIQIANDVRSRLAGLPGHLLENVKLASWYDQSELVRSSAHSVRDAILAGIVLAGGVLFVFLRSVRITLVALCIVPAVLASTVIVMTLLHMSFNIMTLGGMAAAVGLIIDDAIVMIEHIVRRVRAQGSATTAQVTAAAAEFLRPLAGSSSATLIIFAPLALLSGVTGAFFKALSITMGASLAISFVFAWIGVPLLTRVALTQRDVARDDVGRASHWLQNRYERVLRGLLARPAFVLIALLPLMLLGYFASTQVGTGFIPTIDEGGFVLDYRSPPGTALTETDRIVREVERILAAVPDIATYSRRTGTGLGGGLSEPNTGDFFVRLKSGQRRSAEEVMTDVREQIEARVPGLDVELAQLMEDLIGDLTAVPEPIEIKLSGLTPDQLAELAPKVAERIGKVKGVVDVKNGINPAGDSLDLEVDNPRAALAGLDATAIAKQLDIGLTGIVAAQVPAGPKMVGIRVVAPASLRSTTTQLEDFPLRNAEGSIVPLRQVARVREVLGESEISRDNLRRIIAVTARIDGRDLGSTILDIKKILAEPGLIPEGTSVELGGLYEQQQIAFRGLALVFLAAAALVFTLLLVLYESFALAIVVLITALLAVGAVFIGLWIARIELNISAMMGMTMIIGIATEVSIFYFSEFTELAPNRSVVEALVLAGKNRLRPIAMTTLAAILTLLPLAFAFGRGGEMQQPLAIAIVSGLVVQLPLVLLVMPALYAIFLPNRFEPPQPPPE